MHDQKLQLLSELYAHTDTTTLVIASTRVYDDLVKIKNSGFNEAIFRSTKRLSIKKTITDLLYPVTVVDTAIKQETMNSEEKICAGLAILVVDDNDINLKLAEILLKKLGATVTTAISGHEAIEQAKSAHFDLIFMDLQMPGIDGYETSRHIKDLDDNDDNIIIALTANAMIEQLEKITSNGMNDIIIKPISEKAIQDMVNKWLDIPLDLTLPPPTPETADSTLETFSIEEAKKLAAGNETLANELTTMLMQSLPDYKKDISAALNTNNSGELKHHVHKLHGASRCCGTPALRQAALDCEIVIDNNDIENFQHNVALIISEIDLLLNLKAEETTC